jgi:hypothetical protein
MLAQMADGRWQMADGRWQMADGRKECDRSPEIGGIRTRSDE